MCASRAPHLSNEAPLQPLPGSERLASTPESRPSPRAHCSTDARDWGMAAFGRPTPSWVGTHHSSTWHVSSRLADPSEPGAIPPRATRGTRPGRATGLGPSPRPSPCRVVRASLWQPRPAAGGAPIVHHQQVLHSADASCSSRSAGPPGQPVPGCATDAPRAGARPPARAARAPHPPAPCTAPRMRAAATHCRRIHQERAAAIGHRRDRPPNPVLFVLGWGGKVVWILEPIQ